MHGFWMRSGLFVGSLLLLGCSAMGLRLRTSAQAKVKPVTPAPLLAKLPCSSTQKPPHFFVLGGGGAPSYNEIAIEKNVLYFQRTLKAMDFDPGMAQIYFANGNDGRKTVRYIDPKGRERFKAPEIPGILGKANWGDVQEALTQATTKQPQQPIFFYFTGHGSHNLEDENNNAMILWNERQVSVQRFASFLDELPETTPVVTVMVQCYSGAFANFIYQNGDPSAPIALQTRCGFFATIKQLPSVGCTPEVDEADYQDYSSSFFAGLSGINRLGKPVPSADYNRDGQISFAEAHAFAKVDEKGEDLPISTSEAWLRDRLSDDAQAEILASPIATMLQTARPEQKYVVQTWARQFRFDLKQTYAKNYQGLAPRLRNDEKQAAYLKRLELELINIGAEAQLRQRQAAGEVAVIDRLLKCEAGFWGKSQVAPKTQVLPKTIKPSGKSSQTSEAKSSRKKSSTPSVPVD
jgi:hypothetical protein